MRKVVIFTFKGCLRSIFSNTFLGSMLACLVFLYRSFPFFFSMLVSASPVLVCTAVLLGTLLSFGKPVIPGIEKERTPFDTATLQIGVSGDNVGFKRSERISTQKCDKGEVVEGDSLVANEISMIDFGGTSPQLLEGMSFAVKSGERVLEERDREMEDYGFEYKRVKTRELEAFGFEYKSEMFEDRFNNKRTLGRQYSLIMEEDEHLDLENDESPVGSIDSNVINKHALDFPPDSLWKCVNEEEEENHDDDDDDDGDEASDLGSDQTKSSSPDASMADIIPMLDELHPFLYELTPRPANLYHDSSDAASGRSDDSSNESDDDSEHPEETEVAEDESGDGENEDETCGVKEDQTKSAISWTDEDQKNLKNLRTSELERNQRLENLIARQRARRTMRMLTEKNLIDFDDTDLPFNVPHILAKRTNPFDLHQDSYEMGLPPIPGSAPSILLPQKNPFARPYDSSDEKPDLDEDYCNHDLMPFQSKEPIFCRHESFNIRPTLFGTNRTDKQDMSRYRPYFVSEQLGSEGRSYSNFTRQSSELSDSKMSSAPDTESIGSAGYLKELNVNEEETSVMEVRTNAEKDATQEPEGISKIEDTSELVKHGSESSSEDEDSLEFGQVEKRHMIVDEIDMKLHTEDQNGTHTQEFPEFAEGRNHTEEFGISVQSSPQGSYLKITTPLPDDTPQKDPIYDSSPPAFRKNLSSSLVSSGTQDKSEIGLLPIRVKRSVSFSERVTELGNWNMKSNKMFGHVMLDGLTGMIPENRSEMELGGDAEITEQFYLNGKEADLKMATSTIEEKMVQEVNLDSSEPPEDKVEQVADSSSVLLSNGENNTEGASPGSLLILGKSEIGLLPIRVKRSVSFSERVTELGSWNMKRNKMFGHEMLDGLTGMIQENKSAMELEGDAEITEQFYSNENEADLKMAAFTIEENMVQEVNLDLSDPPEDKVEQVADSASVLLFNGANNTEGASPGSLLILGRHLLDDSNAEPKQLREIFPSVPLKMSEFVIVGDAWSEMNSTKEEEPNLEESDKKEALLNAEEGPDCSEKTLEGVHVVASDISIV